MAPTWAVPGLFMHAQVALDHQSQVTDRLAAKSTEKVHQVPMR